MLFHVIFQKRVLDVYVRFDKLDKEYAVLRNISKTSASVSSGFQTRENRWKHEAVGLSAFVVFECLETPMKHQARVFEIVSQSKQKLRSRKRNKIVKIYAN